MVAVTLVSLNSLKAKDQYHTTLGKKRRKENKWKCFIFFAYFSIPLANIRSNTIFYFIFQHSQPYLACSEESKEGFCPHVDTSCSAANTCKTCDTFGGMVSYPESSVYDVFFFTLT
jgi:hypothetical protein